MRLRLGLALLFAIVAIVPLALAIAWDRETMDALVRDVAAERADTAAGAWMEDARDRLDERPVAQREALCSHLELAPAIVLPDTRAVPVPEAADSPWTVRGTEIVRTLRCSSGRAIRLSMPRDALRTLGDDSGAIVFEMPPPEAGERRAVRNFADGAGGFGLDVIVLVEAAPLAVQARARNRLALLVLELATVLAAFGVGWFVAGRVSRPLGELERAAERIGRGDLGVQIDRSGGSAGATFSAFNKMTKELRDAQARAKRAERVAAWRDIARRIAHEIKNPLTPIRMSIETMRRTKQRAHPDFDEIFEESTKTVLEEVERLERIVTEFSRFARLPRPKPTEIDVRELAGQVVALHSPGGDATITDTSPRLPVKLALGTEPARVRADRDQLTQVLVNLVQNAIDAAASKHGAEGHVEVAVDATPEGARIVVSDDGPGIPEEERAKVLEPYYTTKAKGTGLGLAIVDRIVSDHGGTLELGESRAGGARVAITLPRDGPSEDPEASQTN